MEGLEIPNFKTIFAFLISLLVLLSASSAVSAQTYVIQVGIDSHTYQPNENMNASGVVYEGPSTAPANTSVNFTIYNSTYNSTNTTNTTSNGEFSIILQAPGFEGDYWLNVSAGDALVTIPFTVTQVSKIMVELVNETIVVPLVDYPGNVSGVDYRINTTDAKAGNFTTGGQKYWVVVEKDSTTGKYATVYLDDDDTLWFNNSDDPTGMPMHKYLEEGSKIKLGSKQFTIIYIDPQGSEIILAEKVSHKFTGSDSETVNILAIALNSSDSPVSGVDLSYEVFDDEGNQTQTNTSMGTTASNGSVVYYNHSIGSRGGRYHIVVNAMGHVSYHVRTFILTVDLSTPEGNPIFTVAPGDPMVVTIAVLDTSNNTPIQQNFTLHISVSGPGFTESFNETMTNGYLRQTVSAPGEPGTYNIEMWVEYQGIKEKARIKFMVRSYDLFMEPMAKGKGGAMGFAPGKPAALFIGAADMATGGLINLSTLTGNCANISLLEILDKEGNNTFTGTTRIPTAGDDKQSIKDDIFANGTAVAMNMTYFWETIGTGAPSFIREEMKSHFGEDGAVIFFRAPVDTGVYRLKVRAIINGTTEHAYSTMGVQEIFVHAFPVSESGEFTFAFNPGATVYLKIEAFNASDGNPIPPSNITSASLVEVFAEEEGPVTEKMLNESFTSDSENGTVLSFIANDSVIGFHFVKFLITINISGNEVEAVGHGWFMEKLYQIWAYPADERGIYGSNDTVNLKVEVYDSSGRNPQSGINVYLADIRSAETWEFVNTTASVGVTDDNGTATIQIQAPQGGWDSGGYDVKVKIEDPNNVTDYGHGWFEVRNFKFFAYTKEWEATTQQNITLFVEIREFTGEPINANVSIQKIVYFGTWDKWVPPTVVNESVGVTKTINGSGNITLPGGTLTKEGQYAIVLNATEIGDSGSETTRAWLYARPFIVWAEAAAREEFAFEPRYGPTDSVTITVKGYRSIDWSTWPPNGTAIDLNASWVDSIEKEGMWGVKYKTKDDLLAQNNMTYTCGVSPITCNVSFNLTSFASGTYSVVVTANDTSGAESSGWFRFRFEVLRITVPELRKIKAMVSNSLENSTSFQLTETDENRFTAPDGATDWVAGEVRIVDLLQRDPWTEYNVTYLLMNKSSPPKLFVNTTGTNFNESPSYGVGDSFLDAAGNNWSITGLDDTDNYVYLESADGVIGTEDPNNEDSAKLLLVVNKSLSKSGTFIRGDDLWDETWAKTDLDGDGKTECDETGCERYFVVLADSETAGVYDTVLVSNTSNISAGITVEKGGEVGFGTDRPIYLVHKRFKGGTGGGTYKLKFTTNRPGWPGQYLGIFKPGTQVIVPIMVTDPSNESRGIANATVWIPKAIRFSQKGEEHYSLNVSKVNTSVGGIAILKVNTSGIPNGDYFLKVKVYDNNSNKWISTANPWENPRISIRNFIVTGELGLVTQLGPFGEWSKNAGNLFTKKGDLFRPRDTAFMNCNNLISSCGPWGDLPEWYHVEEYEYKSIWVKNDTPDRIYIDKTPQDDFLNLTDKNSYHNLSWTSGELIPIYGPSSTKDYKIKAYMIFENVTYYNYNERYNFTVFKQTSRDERYFNITVDGVDGTSKRANVTVYFSSRGHWVDGRKTKEGIEWREVGLNDRLAWGNLEVVNITNAYVKFTWHYPAVTFKSNLLSLSPENLQGEEKRFKVAGVPGYQMVLYNNILRLTEGDINGWYGQIDSIQLVNASTGEPVGSKVYRVGEWIPEIQRAVVGGELWRPKVFLSNLTIDEKVLYPVPRSENKTFFYDSFTENESGFDFDGNGQLDATKKYYIVFYDHRRDGVFDITKAIFDDDPVIADWWVKENISCTSNCRFKPYDYDHDEEGYQMGWTGSYNKWEDIFRVGKLHWPFAFTEFNETTKNATIFNWREWISPEENITLWVSAYYFNGSPIDGNVSIDKIVGITFGPEGPKITPLTISGTADIEDGVGYLELDVAGSEPGDYLCRFVVTEDQYGLKEKIDKHFGIKGPGPGGVGG